MSKNTIRELHDSSSILLLRDLSTDSDNLEILLHKHRKFGEWLQPGGKREPGEHSFQTAMRELEEETGYTPDQYLFLNPTKTPRISSLHIIPLPTPIATHALTAHGLVDDTYAAILRPEHTFNPPSNGKLDTHGFEWFNLHRVNGLGKMIPENVLEMSRWLLTNACMTVIEPPQI